MRHESTTSSTTMPVLFAGHGAPTLLLEDNPFSQGLKQIAQELPRPKAMVVISAHWMTTKRQVTAAIKPSTIHDFYGFPEELYQMRYPAPGSPELAQTLCHMIPDCSENLQWGLDHGTWSILSRLYPRADIPVVQLSLTFQDSATGLLELGRQLAPLREQGILIIGSGNIVHNLRALSFEQPALTPEWALSFEKEVHGHVMNSDAEHFCKAGFYDRQFRTSHPTPEHFWPLLVAMGASHGLHPKVFNRFFDYGSVAMTSYCWN